MYIEPHMLRWPLPQGVTYKVGTPFAPNAPDMETKQDGMDIYAPEGTTILATTSGFVNWVVKNDPEFGNVIVVQHNDSGCNIVYRHLGTITENLRGKTIREGEMLGTIGRTGRVKEPHLHLMVMQGRKPLDPQRYFTAGHRVAW